jgi:hypothetical protein
MEEDMRSWSRSASLTFTACFALFGGLTITAAHGQNLAARGDAVPIARVTAPSGEGVKDLAVIKDGITTEQSYDSYDGANVSGEDWYGYTWSSQVFVDKLVYYEGSPSEAGGFWRTLTVQYTMDGTSWVEAGGVAISPAYDFADDAVRTLFTKYDISFTGCLITGVRLYGRPGGPAEYTSIAELEAYGTKPPVVCARILPSGYEAGEELQVSLVLTVDPQQKPTDVTIAEILPSGLTVSDPGTGDTSTPGGIVWNLTGDQVQDQTIPYTLSVPPDKADVIAFNGIVNYEGHAGQKVSGSHKVAPQPESPSGLVVAFDADAHLSWSPNDQQGILGYRVYRSEGAAAFAEFSSLILDTFFIDYFVEEGKTYRYKVIAENVTGSLSDLAASEATEPGTPSMTRRQFEDYDFGGGNYPGGPLLQGYPARSRSDLYLSDFFYQNSQQTNDYRPDDPIAIPAFNPEEHYIAQTTRSDWWRFTFDVPADGYVKIGVIRAASDGDATLEFLWDESHKGWFFFNTNSPHTYEILPVAVPAFFSTAGPHTLRIILSEGNAELDYFGIGFSQPEPQRVPIFTEEFESYTTTADITSPSAGWTIVNGSGIPEGAWRLWSTTGPPLGYESADLPGMIGKYVVSNGEFAGPGDLDEQLITPVIDCTAYTKVTVQFGSNIRIYESDLGIYDQFFDLDISICNDATQSWSDWETVSHHEGTDGDSSSPRFADISARADGKTIKLRWRFWQANYDYWWAVDNIRVSGELPGPGPGAVLSVGIATGAISLQWEPFGTGSYRVQYTDNLVSGTWADVPGATWPISETHWTGDDVSGARSRAYRIVSE